VPNLIAEPSMPAPHLSSLWRRRAATNLVLALAASVSGIATGSAQQDVPARDRAVAEPPQWQNMGEIAHAAASAFPAGLPETLRSGVVRARVHVLPDGSVDSVVIERSPRPEFAGPARSLATRLRFRPGRRADGTPVSAWTTVPLLFSRHDGRTDGVQQGREVDFSGVGKAGSGRMADGNYELSAVEVQPQLQNRDEVQRMLARTYPPALRDSGVVGHVTVSFRILEDGTVDPEGITVEQASRPEFAPAAVACVRTLRFSPARIGGRAVKVWVHLPITYKLMEKSPPRSRPDTGSPAPAPPRP
jgi:TonB family protein